MLRRTRAMLRSGLSVTDVTVIAGAAPIADVAPIASLVSELNPKAELIAKSSYADIPDEWWENLLHRPFDKDAAEPAEEDVHEGESHNHAEIKHEHEHENHHIGSTL